MRTDRALEIALRPAEHNRDVMIGALTALRVAYVQKVDEVAQVAPALREAGALRLERAEVDGRRRSAVLLWEQGNERLAHVLTLLDELDPARARELRAAWGIWPSPPR